MDDNTYNYNNKVYSLDPLDLLIKDKINALPHWCKIDGNLGHHEWVHAYQEGFIPDGKDRIRSHNPIKDTTVRLTHFICKHCYAVSTDYTTNPVIKRAR
jgi:hypothetical protein